MAPAIVSRCEPTTNRKNGASAPSRVGDCFSGHLSLFRRVLLFRLARLPIKLVPSQKRRETTTREGFSKNPRVDDARLVVVVRSRLRWWFFGGASPLVFGVEKTVSRKISLFSFEFFLQKETKDVFVPITCVFSDRHQSRTQGETRHRTPKTPPRERETMHRRRATETVVEEEDRRRAAQSGNTLPPISLLHIDSKKEAKSRF